MPQNIVFGTELNTSGFSAGAQKLLAELETIRQSFIRIGSAGGAQAVGNFLSASAIQAKNYQTQIEGAKARLHELIRLQAKADAGQKTVGTGLSGLQGVNIGKTERSPGYGQVRAGIADTRKEIEQLEAAQQQFFDTTERRSARLASLLPQTERARLGISKQRMDTERQIEGILSGQARSDVIKQQIADLAKAKQEALALKDALVGGRIAETPRRTADALERELAAAERLPALKAEDKRLSAELVKISQELAALPAKGADAERELLQLKKQSLVVDTARNRASLIRTQGAVDRGPSLGATLQIGGLDKSVAQIDQLVSKYDAWMSDLESGRGLESSNKTLNKWGNRVRAAASELEKMAVAGDSSDAALNRQAELYNLLDKYVKKYYDTLRKGREEGAKGVGPVDQIEKDAKSKLPRLEKTLIGAFEGFGRRFEATLQFAISGALIFGVQRLAREFVQAAIEVERAFADIQTALEFDVAAPRGTNAFAQAVDNVRLKVLQVADEFNILPTEANKAAFVMVSRFGDVDNALKAVRAQLLATKVSGIDQVEVLRALTAVAEGFAGAIFEANDAMSIQEKLMQRETIAANLYAEALDLAVYIQQKFGIETEDVLEGTARATEVFRIMGFTMAETAALVSAVSRQLGQTGVQASEKLVRSIGQLTSPEIRNELLALAEASETFFLTQADFSTGARAWEAIADQFDRIQKAEPGVAATILQIVGQRREAEAVAAALGTIDLQQAIVSGADSAVGAAEKRYSFLAVTVSERIKSIQAAFQELAQNMERIGFLTPLKLMLGLLDGALSVINKIIQTVDKMMSALNGIRIGDFGLGDALKTAISLALVLRGVVALWLAGINAGATLGAAAGKADGGGVSTVLAVGVGKAFKELKERIEKAGGGFKAFGVLADGAQKGLVAAYGKVVSGIQGLIAAFVAARAAVLADTATRLQSLVVSGAKLFAWAAAIGLATVAIVDMVRGAKVAEQALRDVGSADKAGASAAREAAAAGKSPAEVRVARFEAQLRTLTEAFESGEPVLNDWQQATIGWSKAIANIDWTPRAGGTLGRRDTFDPDQPFGLVGGPGSFENQALLEAQKRAERQARKDAEADRVRLIEEQKPGFQAWWDKLMRDANYSFFQASFEALSEDVAAAPRAVIGSDPELADQWKELQAKISKAIAAVNQAIADNDPNMEARFSAELIKLQTESENLLTLFDEFWRGVEGTIEGVRQRIEQAERDLNLGRTTGEDYLMTMELELLRLIQLKTGLEGEAKEQEQLVQTQKDIDQLQRQIIDYRAKRLDIEYGWTEFIANKEKQYQERLKIINQKLENEKEDDAREVLEQERARLTAEYYESLAKVTENAEIKALEKKLSRASNTKDQLAIIDALKKAYKRQIANLILSIDSFVDLIRVLNDPALYAAYEALDDLEFRGEDIKDDVEVRLARANARLGGPIQNKMNQINGELAALNIQLGQTTSGSAEYAELLVQIGEKTADKAEEAARIVAAQTLATAGARNSLGALSASLDAAQAELDRIAAAYGKNTAEWSEAALALEDLQFQLGEAQAELFTLQARLLSDSTDPYQQAVIDWQAAVNAANVEGLGDLEQAQADWAAKQAADAKDAAEMDDKLFRLKFLYDTDQIGVGSYISALEAMRDAIDLGTRAGMEAFLQIQGLIDGLSDQANDMAFNIPTSIRLPTIFEVRRALAADQMGVNYQDNRQQDINVYVRDEVDMASLLRELDQYAGGQINVQSNAYAPGAAGITLGSR